MIVVSLWLISRRTRFAFATHMIHTLGNAIDVIRSTVSFTSENKLLLTAP